MIEERIKNIRLLIQQAGVCDKDSGALIDLLKLRIPALHSAIKLPDGTAPQHLFDFSVRYIEHVPNFIEAITDIAKSAKIEEHTSPLLRIATDYFLRPPETIENSESLEELFKASYLAHRLLEEINDRFIVLCGAPLAPMDMTRANIIAHEIIGEPLANDLDQAVLFSAEILLNEHHFSGKSFDHLVVLHKSSNKFSVHSRWPCLAENLSVQLNFNEPF